MSDFSSSAQVKIKVKIQFRPLLKRNSICFRFSCCSTRTELCIDVSIINVGLILTKLGRFQLFSTSQNTSQIQFRHFLRNIKLVRTFPLMYYYNWAEIDEETVISILGVRTDRHDFGIIIGKHIGTQKIST